MNFVKYYFLNNIDILSHCNECKAELGWGESRGSEGLVGKVPLQRKVYQRAEAAGRSSIQESRGWVGVCLMGGQGGR